PPYAGDAFGNLVYDSDRQVRRGDSDHVAARPRIGGPVDGDEIETKRARVDDRERRRFQLAAKPAGEPGGVRRRGIAPGLQREVKAVLARRRDLASAQPG